MPMAICVVVFVTFSLFQFEFLESSAGACTYAGTYVLALEWANSKYRVLGSAMVSLSFPIGEIVLGIVAMYVHDFRILIRILYTPGLLVIIYFWLVPESVRWLLVTGRVDYAIKVLRRMAWVNGKHLSANSVEAITSRYSANYGTKTDLSPNQEVNPEKHSILQTLGVVLKSKTLCLRFLNCCYQWTAATFSYYGLSMYATHIPAQNRYVSFISVVAVEIPGIFVALLLLNRMKRKTLLFATLTLAAFSIITTSWIPNENEKVVLMLFMLGKTSITCAFNVLYIFTAEQWPTNIRTTVMNSCSMIGRIGAMVAPLTAILVSLLNDLK